MSTRMFASIKSIPLDASYATTDPAFAKTSFDISSFSWGLSSASVSQSGSGSGAGKVSFQDISFSIIPSNLSVGLLSALARGMTLPTVTVYIRNRPSGAADTTYETTNVRVTSLTIGNSDGDPGMHTVSFSFAKVKVTNVGVGASGTSGTTTTFTWDIAANTGS